jgi:hypothetical protein
LDVGQELLRFVDDDVLLQEEDGDLSAVKRDESGILE